MNIPGIILHPTASKQLDEILNAPSHAVLLAGPTGIGKTHIARHLAAKLLGSSVDSLQNHAYFRTINTEKGSIAIEQIRELIGFFRLSVPGKSQIKRVAVIEDAEAMSREAQNALLKLLEEPPIGSVLLLTSSYPDQLLSTIRSRAQIVVLTAPESSTLTEYFVSKGYDSAVTQRILMRTGTNVAEATRLLTLDTSEGDDALALVKQALTGTSYDRMLLVDSLSKQKDQATQFVSTLAATAMASLQAAAIKNPSSLTRWQTILSAAHTADTALQANGNAKLVLTELMLAL